MTRAAYEVPPDAAGRYAPAVRPTGLILGRNSDGTTAMLRIFRPEPTRVTLLGGTWAAWLLVFRSFALGARVLVRTSDTARWNGLGEASTGHADRLRLVDERPAPATIHAAAPLLVVSDLDGNQADDLQPTTPWHTMLTVAAQLNDAAAATLPAADATIVQRLWPQQAEYAATAIGIDPDAVLPVRDMPDDVVAVLRRDGPAYVRLAPTAIERRLFGPPRR
jgi:hypothetical protein